MSKKNNFFKEKLALIKELYPDKEIKVSKTGNYYVQLSSQKLEIDNFYNSPNRVTKNLLKTMGHVKGKTREEHEILLLGHDDGKVLYKPLGNGKITSSYKVLSGGFSHMLNLVNSKIYNIAVVGKKYEWIKNHPELRDVKLAYQFSSLKEFKNFLGYRFINVEDFIYLFDFDSQPDNTEFGMVRSTNNFNATKFCLFYGHNLTHKCRVNIVYLIQRGKEFKLKDTIDMMISQGDIRPIPKSPEKLTELHDELVTIQNLKNLNEYDDKPVELSEHYKKIIECCTQTGLKFDVLDSPRKLAERGILQHHCLASYVGRLRDDLFLSIHIDDNDRYEAHIDQTTVRQICGYNNKRAPQELRATLMQLIVMNGNKEIPKPTKKWAALEPVDYFGFIISLACILVHLVYLIVMYLP